MRLIVSLAFLFFRSRSCLHNSLRKRKETEEKGGSTSERTSCFSCYLQLETSFETFLQFTWAMAAPDFVSSKPPSFHANCDFRECEIIYQARTLLVKDTAFLNSLARCLKSMTKIRNPRTIAIDLSILSQTCTSKYVFDNHGHCKSVGIFRAPVK